MKLPKALRTGFWRVFVLSNNVSRLVEVSNASKCTLRALPVQLPFCSYEDSVSALLEKEIPDVSNNYNEVGTSNDSVLGSPISKMKTTKH